jgi:hypothetical protein
VTLYARGYRPYDRDASPGTPAPWARALRFGPIAVEGWRDAKRGKAFRFLGTIIVIVTTINGFLLYFQDTVLSQALQGPARWSMGAFVPQNDPSFWLRGAVVQTHNMCWALAILVTLFVGCGLVADDVKARALPLYLSRPITPFDYYLGKLLIPVAVLASLVLAPMLFLVLLSVLMQPTEEMLGYLAKQGDLILAIATYFGVVALGYTSVVLLFSAWASRRIFAVVLAAVVLFGGEIVRNAARPLSGTGADLLRATSIVGDAKVLLFHVMDRPLRGFSRYPSPEAALVVLAAVVLLAAFAVLRRARTTEVAG